MRWRYSRLLASLLLWLTLSLPALAQGVITPVQMRDANLTTTNVQNLISTLNVFTAPRTLTLPGRGALNSYFLQFVDTANAVNGVNTLTIQMADGGLINGAPTLVISNPGVYLFIIPNSSGYSASVNFNTSVAGGTNGQIQYNNAGLLGGFTTIGDATINTATGQLTLATVNANVGAFGTSTQCTSITVNAKGLITAASQTTCTPAITSITGFGTGVQAALQVNVGSAGAPILFNGAAGTPSSITLTNGTGLPLSTGITGFGTGVATALGINVGSAGAPVLFNGAGGTPSSLTLTNATGLPVGSITGLGAGCATWLGTPSSANLRSCMTDETGTGLLYFQGGAAGTPSSITLTNGTGLPNAGLVNSSTTVAGSTCTLGSTCAISSVTNTLGADVAMNNNANYFDGPSTAQGTTGTWFASGTVTLTDTAGVAAFICVLNDGNTGGTITGTKIASGRITSTGASNPTLVSLSGIITNPAGNIRMSCRDSASNNGVILFNNSGNSKDSTLTVLRLN